ncbi:MAG: hypothetical protein ACYTJ0_21050 [Planctomycetota bacterium]|jgi:hypothetical protein
MSVRRIVHHGRIYVTVSDAATCYGLEIRELQQWVAAELIEPPAEVEGEPAWPAVRLERIAALVRCTHLLGLELATIRALADLGHLELE